jgi:hypothetical protein
MNNRLLRPIAGAVVAIANFLLNTISDEALTDQTGDQFRTIQNA